MKKQNVYFLSSDTGCGINCHSIVKITPDETEIIDRMDKRITIKREDWREFCRLIRENNEIHLKYIEGLELSDFEVQELGLCVIENEFEEI